MGIDVVEGGEDRDEEIEVRQAVLLHAEVIHHQDKGDGARDVAKKKRC